MSSDIFGYHNCVVSTSQGSSQVPKSEEPRAEIWPYDLDLSLLGATAVWARPLLHYSMVQHPSAMYCKGPAAELGW